MRRMFSAPVKSMADSEVIKRVNDGWAEVIVSGTPEELATFVNEHSERLVRVIKQIGDIEE